MTVTMMNLFIAMLCLSYSIEADNAQNGFLRSRACIVLDLHAIKAGAEWIRCRRRERISLEAQPGGRSSGNSFRTSSSSSLRTQASSSGSSCLERAVESLERAEYA